MRVSDAVCTEFNDEANGGQKEIEGAMGGGAGEGVGRGREGGGGWGPGKRRSRGELTDEKGIEEVMAQDMVEE